MLHLHVPTSPVAWVSLSDVRAGGMDIWMSLVQSLLSQSPSCCLAPTVQKKEKWVKDNQGQMIITAGQMVWTHECEKALAEQDGARKNLKILKKKWISYLNKLTTITRSKLNKIERNKVCM